MRPSKVAINTTGMILFVRLHWRKQTVTGRGANLLLLDDLLKDTAQARSESVRRSMHDWFQHVAYTRLAPGGAIVLIQTRWHQDDLAGRLLHEHAGDNWEVVTMPAIAEVDDELRRQVRLYGRKHFQPRHSGPFVLL